MRLKGSPVLYEMTHMHRQLMVSVIQLVTLVTLVTCWLPWLPWLDALVFFSTQRFLLVGS